MSNLKGNGIEAIQRNLSELGRKYQKAMTREKEDGLKISDLLDQNDRQEIEIRRLNKAAEQTMSDYGKVCDGCCKAVQREEELTEQNEVLTNDIDQVRLLCTVMGCVFLAVSILYATGLLTIEWSG